jgi:hypothetical protein
MVDIEKARVIVAEQLAKGTPEKQIRDSMWNAGYTQAEIGSIIQGESPAKQSLIKYSPGSAMSGSQPLQDSSKPLVDVQKPSYEAPNTGSKLTIIAIAAAIVIIFTILPFAMPKPAASGEKISYEAVSAYQTKLETKIAQMGGLANDISITMRSNRETVIMTGRQYKSGGGKERLEATAPSASIYGSRSLNILTIKNENGTFTRHETDYFSQEPYWTRETEDMIDVESSLIDTDYYNQGQVACGGEMCTIIYASYEGSKLTMHCREDGFCPLVKVESPSDYLEMRQENPVFGPVDNSLFRIPAGEQVAGEQPYSLPEMIAYADLEPIPDNNNVMLFSMILIQKLGARYENIQHT